MDARADRRAARDTIEMNTRIQLGDWRVVVLVSLKGSAM